MNHLRSFSILLILFSCHLLAYGQHEASVESTDHHEFKHHRIAYMISHTHIPNGFNSEEKNNIIVPSWGLNYEYWFNEHWAIGLHNDMKITTYVIERENGSKLERERPIIISMVGIYKFDSGLEIVTGFGREIEQNEGFWVFRAGLEYEFELGNHWDLAPSLIFDAKETLYHSYALGLTVGKKF